MWDSNEQLNTVPKTYISAQESYPNVNLGSSSGLNFPKNISVLLSAPVQQIKFLGVNKPYVILKEINQPTKNISKDSLYVRFKYLPNYPF